MMEKIKFNMFDKFIDWKFLDLWRVPLNTFSTTIGFHKEVDSITKKIAKSVTKEMKFQGILVALGNDEITVQKAIDKINELDNE